MRLFILASLLVLASAFTLDGPTNPTAGEVTEIHWDFTVKDPATFDLFLLNNPNDPFSLVAVLGENLETDLGEIHTLLPASIPAGFGLSIQKMSTWSLRSAQSLRSWPDM
ncbi:hypothetical protein C8R45DRAFT_1042008 [Mycena sanguinolenta]|nr:hypothetical protein C8R45DRAFT_1042008 [Mycena sanguinolenta]